jgi:hypothetical protein
MSRQTLLCGHQPGFHHPGILAKRVMQHAAASSEGTSSTWILVDQDVGDPGAIRFPDLDAQGVLIERTWHAVSHQTDHPTGTSPWKNDLTDPPDISPQMPESVGKGLRDIHRSLSIAEGETLAERFHHAQENLLQERLAGLVGPTPDTLKATTILRNEPGMSMLSSILDAPEACALAWNDAGRLVPRSARTLRIDRADPRRTEVPCWTLDDTGRRVPATVEDLHHHLDGTGEVHPRAFLMTAVLRSTSTRPMIHGTGGGRYELVTDRWATDFLGIDLPPISVVTADLRLPLEAPDGGVGGLEPHEALRRLEHDPWPGDTTKARLSEAIRNAPRRSEQRRRLFDEMQARLTIERSRLAPQLQALRKQSQTQNSDAQQRRIARDRTWSWPLHEDEALRGLELKTLPLEG